MAVCGFCDTNFRNARNQRLHVELALVQLCQVLDKKKNDELAASESASIPKPAAAKPVTAVNTVASQSKPQTQTTQTTPARETVNQPKYVSTTPSIKNLMKDIPAQPVVVTTTITPDTKEVDDSDEVPTEIRDNKFNQEQLNHAFSHFVESIKLEKPRLYSTLATFQPILAGKEIIEITLSNQAQLDDFNKNVKSDMIKRLRDELLNDNIVLDIIISEFEQQNMLYTAEEKYRHLVSKNPTLGKLKQQMNLDFD
jgi:DNA polymerase-3 subunit gamma/tau